MTQQQPPPPPIPAPVPQPESDFYFEKCRQGELWLRRCNDCGSAYFYPRDFCPLPHCFSRDTDWIQSRGRGVIHTFAIVHRGPTPPFRDRAPYVPVIVELDEGAAYAVQPGAVRTLPRTHQSRNARRSGVRGAERHHHHPLFPPGGLMLAPSGKGAGATYIRKRARSGYDA